MTFFLRSAVSFVAMRCSLAENKGFKEKFHKHLSFCFFVFFCSLNKSFLRLFL
jgi:hypothetical protein